MVPHIHVLFLPLLGILSTFHGGFPSGSTVKNPHASARDAGLIPHLGNFEHYFREGNGTPLQYSCLENPTGGGAWWAAVHGVAKSRTRLSDFTFHFLALEKEMATHSSVLA